MRLSLLSSALFSVALADSNSPSPSSLGPEVGWRVRLNATWIDTNCKNVNKLLPILQEKIPLNDYFGRDSDLEKAMSCRDFGECETDRTQIKYVVAYVCIDSDHAYQCLYMH